MAKKERLLQIMIGETSWAAWVMYPHEEDPCLVVHPQRWWGAVAENQRIGEVVEDVHYMMTLLPEGNQGDIPLPTGPAFILTEMVVLGE